MEEKTVQGFIQTVKAKAYKIKEDVFVLVEVYKHPQTSTNTGARHVVVDATRRLRIQSD